MVDIQATEEIVKWTVNGITILLMVIAGSISIKKNNNVCLGVAIVGNLLAYYLTRSPLICMIISISCIIWASMSKGGNKKISNSSVSKSSVKAKDEIEDEKENKIKCRFCKKSYSAEYNGCPYCKKV